MSEEYARFKQYEYRANSNLVLTPEARSRDHNEPTGEPETLWGKMKGKMGDRVSFSKPKELEEKLEKMRKKRARKDNERSETTNGPAKKRKGLTGPKSILAATEHIESGYRPKTKETRAAYEQLLSFIKEHLGDQPQDVLRGAADEILAVLKTDTMKAPDKKATIEKLLTTLSNERFSDLQSIGRAITDFSEDAQASTDTLDDELGVAVVFDEEEEDDDEFEVKDEDSEDEDVDVEETVEDTSAIEALGKGDEEAMEDGPSQSVFELDPREIDAFWLQRKISTFESDPNASRDLAEKVFGILQAADQRYIENELVFLLDYEKFDFIKLLLKNQKKIVYCTRLAKAQNDEERKIIEEEMQADAETSHILNQLRGGKIGRAHV